MFVVAYRRDSDNMVGTLVLGTGTVGHSDWDILVVIYYIISTILHTYMQNLILATVRFSHISGSEMFGIASQFPM